MASTSANHQQDSPPRHPRPPMVRRSPAVLGIILWVLVTEVHSIRMWRVPPNTAQRSMHLIHPSLSLSACLLNRRSRPSPAAADANLSRLLLSRSNVPLRQARPLQNELVSYQNRSPFPYRALHSNVNAALLSPRLVLQIQKARLHPTCAACANLLLEASQNV